MRQWVAVDTTGEDSEAVADVRKQLYVPEAIRPADDPSKRNGPDSRRQVVPHYAYSCSKRLISSSVA
jgi:hypothetical protein